MFKKFFPQRDIFFIFFEKHAALSIKASQQLMLFANGEKNADEVFITIKAYEHEADTLAHQCIETLHKSFITPIDRMEIYNLITKLDDIMDEFEDIITRFVQYKITQLNEPAIQLIKILIASTVEVEACVKEFRKMKITDSIKIHFFNINHLENEADMFLMHAIGRLFDEENDPKNLIRWKEIYEHLEEGTDLCEDVANILEGIILENE